VRVGDKDKDGTLTKEEFLAAVKHNEEPVAGKESLDSRGRRPGGGEFDFRRIFDMLDKNKDGKLTREEVADKPRVVAALDLLGKDEITADDFAEQVGKGMKKFRDGEGRPRRPEGRPPKDGGPGGAGPEQAGPGGPGPHGPNFMRVIDANKDGKLSKNELAKAADKFAELDENKDGELDPHELMGPPPKGMGDEMAEEPRGPLGGRFGRGPQAGGPEGAGPRRRGEPEQGPPGEGSPSEARRGPGGPPPDGGTPQGSPPERGRRRGPEGFGGPGGPDGPGGRGAEFIHRMFEQLDANDDGKISQDEAPAKLKKNFLQIDHNGDGAIDEHELAHVRPGGKPAGGKEGDGDRPRRKRPEADTPEGAKP
jgi:Ca2+-binding EF-hand superfamily protein